MNSLNEMQEGIIKEIGNIGAGHIMMNLSLMTKVKTDMDITSVYEFKSSEFWHITQYLKSSIYALDFRFIDTFRGGFLLLFPKEVLPKVIISMRSASSVTLNNLLTGYSKSLEDYLGIRCRLEIKKRYDSIESEIVQDVFGTAFDGKDKILLIDTRYSMESKPMTGHMFLYFCSEDYDSLLSRINNKLKEMVA